MSLLDEIVCATAGAFCMAVAAAASMAVAHPRAAYFAIDGDTLNVEATGERIRILGIDAPELHPARCQAEYRLGEQAKRTLQALVDTGPVEIDRITTDRYGRTVARVLVHGHDVGPYLISLGLARPYRYPERRRSWCFAPVDRR